MPDNWVVETATGTDTGSLATLLFDSSPELLSHILGDGNQAKTLDYLRYSLTLANGQYGYQNHRIIKQEDIIIGISSTWHDQLPRDFDSSTVDTLHQFFGVTECMQIFKRSAALAVEVAKPSAQQLVIGHLSTNSKFQRRGVAAALIRDAIKYAIKLDKSEVIVDVEQHNTPARNCYLKLGFKACPAQFSTRFLRMVRVC